MKLELENEKLQEKLNTFEATEVEETKAGNRGSVWCNKEAKYSQSLGSRTPGNQKSE